MSKVEILTISQTKNGVPIGNISVWSNPDLKKGERMLLADRVFVSPDDFKKISKMRRSRAIIRFIIRLRENAKNRPIVKPNIVLDESVPDQSS
jgi:hypothetical protein